MNPTIEQGNLESRQSSPEVRSEITPVIEGVINQEQNIIPVTGSQTMEAVKDVPVTADETLTVGTGYGLGSIGETTENSLFNIVNTALISKMRHEKTQVE